MSETAWSKGREGEESDRILQMDCYFLKKKVNLQFLGEGCIIVIKMLKRGIFDKYPKIFSQKLHIYFLF